MAFTTPTFLETSIAAADDGKASLKHTRAARMAKQIFEQCDTVALYACGRLPAERRIFTMYARAVELEVISIERQIKNLLKVARMCIPFYSVERESCLPK